MLMKPGVDTFQVANKVEPQSQEETSTRVELMGTQIVELVFESISATIIKAFAMFAERGDRSRVGILSPASCIVMSACIIMLVSCECDSSKELQRYDPS